MECRNPNGIYCRCCGKTHMNPLAREIIRLMGRDWALGLIPKDDPLDLAIRFTGRGKKRRAA